MLRSVEGIIRGGRVELLEPLQQAEGARVVVTVLPAAGAIDLRDRGIDEAQAADLRARLAGIRGDWERPEMDVYDDEP